MKTKVCFKCGRRLAISSFYAHPQMGDGHLGKCKRCTKKDVREHRRTHSESVCAYDRMRNATPERIAARAEKNMLDRQLFPGKARARNAVNNAIRDGKMVSQPCEVCGNTKAVGHHDDYRKPLDVRWLCQLHHMRHHFAKP